MRFIPYLVLFGGLLLVGFAALLPDNAPYETLYSVNLDGGTPSPFMSDTTRAYYWPAWSPDGTTIAVTVSARGQGGELYLMNVDTGAMQPLTGNGRNNYFADWSPDGGTIAYLSQQGGDVETSEVYTIRADGTDETRLTENDAWEYGVSWSPDGQTIAFGSERGGEWQIYLMNADGSDQTPVSVPAHGNAPTFSPEGDRIAFTSNRDGDDEIFVMNADGSDQQNLTDNDLWDDQPLWSPEGSRIAFTSYRDELVGIYTIAPDGGDVLNLTPGMDWIAGFPTWSPDSRRIVFHTRALTAQERGDNSRTLAAIAGGILIVTSIGILLVRRLRRV